MYSFRPSLSLKHSLYSAGRSTVLILALSFLLFFFLFQSPLHPMHRITVLRLIRSSIFLFGSLLLVRLLLPESSEWKTKEKTAGMLALLWLLPYGSVFSRLPGFFQGDMGNYFIFPSVLFASTVIFLELASHSRKAQPLLCFLCTLVLFLLELSGLAYCFYFFHYGTPLDEIALLSILATTPREAYNYLSSLFSLPLLAGLFLALTAGFRLLFHGIETGCRRAACRTLEGKKWIILPLVLLYFFGNYLTSIFPADLFLHLYRKNGPLRAFTELQRNLPRNARTLKLEKPAPSLSGSIVLVLGESACRDDMSAFADLPVNTTPWEKSLRRNPDFFFYPHSYSNFPNTVMAVTQALTSANQYNKKPLKYAVDIMTLAKTAGYETYWISTQEQSSVSDAGITVIARQSDHQIWIKGPDEDILQSLAQIPAEKKNFIVLHLMGSHFRYDHRIPQAYVEKQHWTGADKTEKTLWYHRSLHYTDSVLKAVFEESGKLPLQAMIYVSDHGEDMELTHTASPFQYNMVRIPLWIYLSPAYQHAHPQTVQQLRAHENAVFTNDLLFDTLSGILQAPSNFYNSQYDLTSPDYSITRDNALTLHGKKRIAEDRQ